jgi:hypothetical protein
LLQCSSGGSSAAAVAVAVLLRQHGGGGGGIGSTAGSVAAVWRQLQFCFSAAVEAVVAWWR